MMRSARVQVAVLVACAGCSAEVGFARVKCQPTTSSERMTFDDFLHPGDDVRPGDDEFAFELTQDAVGQRGGLAAKITPQDRLVGECGDVTSWTYSVSMELRFNSAAATPADGITVSLVDGSRLVDIAGLENDDPDLGDVGGCLACNGDSTVGCMIGYTVPGWTVELDTYQNSFPLSDSGFDPEAALKDPSDLHLAISEDCAVGAPSTYLNLEEHGVGWDTLTSDWQLLTVELTPTAIDVAFGDTPGLSWSGDFGWPDYLLITGATGSASSLQVVRDVTNSIELSFDVPEQQGDTFFDQESGLSASSN